MQILQNASQNLTLLMLAQQLQYNFPQLVKTAATQESGLYSGDKQLYNWFY